MKLGIQAKFWPGDTCQLMHVMWVRVNRLFYLIQSDRDFAPPVYSSVPLLKALRAGSVDPIEYAPRFEWAMASILIETESLQVSWKASEKTLCGLSAKRHLLRPVAARLLPSQLSFTVCMPFCNSSCPGT